MRTGASTLTLGMHYLASLVASVGMAAAQYPIEPIDVEEDFRVIVQSSLSKPYRSFAPTALQPRMADLLISSEGSSSQSSDFGDLCGTYTTGARRHGPMNLYLGEGAREHLDTIKEAVVAWNRIFVRNVINLNEIEASYPLYASFPYEEGASEYYSDNSSVIYFSSRGSNGRFGYVLARHELDERSNETIAEADLFVWEPSQDSGNLDLLIGIQHVIGHALGLKDNPISGNIMSHDYRLALEQILAPFVLLGILPDYDEQNLLPGELGLFSDPQYESLIRALVRPGEQDKNAMMCNYFFATWGK